MKWNARGSFRFDQQHQWRRQWQVLISFAWNDLVRRYWSFFAKLFLPSIVAWVIRDWSLLTCLSMTFQWMLFHWISISSGSKVAHFSIREVIWLALFIKVLSSITMNHHDWKSASFQRGAKFELLSHPLQASIRFFHVPIPSKPLSTLRFSTPPESL